MAMVHDMLYQSDEFIKLPFNIYIAKIVNYLEKLYQHEEKKIKINFDTDKLELNINQAIPCALIINELVINAFEHAFTDRNKGLILVSIKIKNGFVTVAVIDDGKGMPEDLTFEGNSTLGLMLVNTLTKQLNATPTIKREKGTRIDFNFAVKERKGSSSSLLAV